MNCTRARDTFSELLDRRTAPAAHPEARAHLAACPECQRDFAALAQTAAALDALPLPAPSPRLRREFYALLEEEKNSAASVRAAAERSHRARHRGLLRWVAAPLAGCALVAVSFVAGTRFGPAAAPTPAPAETLALRKVAELEQKLDAMGRLVVATSLVQQQHRPANDRLRTVLTSASSAGERPNDSALHELIGALALDPSVNVRLRALDGLFPHADQEVVRAGVLASLSREENPIVQVSMIDFLALARDVEARPALERIAVSAEADTSVRDAARRALTLF